MSVSMRFLGLTSEARTKALSTDRLCELFAGWNATDTFVGEEMVCPEDVYMELQARGVDAFGLAGG